MRLKPYQVGKGLRHPFDVALDHGYAKALASLSHSLRLKEPVGAKVAPKVKGQPKPLVPVKNVGGGLRLPMPFLRPPVTS